MQDITKYNAQIIHAFWIKDDSAILKFYNELWPRVRSFILKTGGTEDQAKDIMQEATTALYINIKQKKFENRPKTSIATYFIQLCKYRWYDVLKSAHLSKTDSINVLENDLTVQQEDDLENQIDQIQHFSQLHHIIKMLDKRCKEILRDFYWKKRSLSEIALDNNLTVASTKNAKYRCMTRLKKLFHTKKALGV